MAASHTLPHSSFSRKSGCVVLNGWGIRIQVNAGQLLLHDGIADDRRTIRLPRVARDLKRIIVIGSDGFASFEALRWIAEIGASLIFLNRAGKLIFVSGPSAPSDPKLRRAQALALSNGTALRISKELISQKVEGQAVLVRDMLQNSTLAGMIEKLRAELPGAQSIETVRIIEAQGAKVFWQSWADVPILWPRKDERRVPEHWKRFGSRISPLTHSPRLAANPPNAILNFLYSVLEAESRLALAALGLDPGIGLLHVDTPSRDSLACDLMEVVRPKVDAFVVDWLQREPLRKSDFWEDRNGNCRLVSALAIKLSQTADTWRKLVAPVAEYVAQELWSSISKPTSTLARQLLASRLTQAHRRAVKGSGMPAVKQPRPEHVCSDCGAKIRNNKKLCAICAKQATSKTFRAGRRIGQRPEYLAKRASTMRVHRRAIQDWEPSALPAWLTRDIYVKRVVPALAHIPKSEVRKALGVSEPYSIHIQMGKRIPHPRHWQALAQLAAVNPRPA